MEGDLTCQKVPSGYIINREGRHGSSTFFWLKSLEELGSVVTELSIIYDKELRNGKDED